MNRKTLLMGCLSMLAFGGCAAEQLSTRGGMVTVGPNAPPDSCQNLGMVIGQGGGLYGGAWINNEDLVRFAMNDAQNKAAALGATRMQASPPQFGGGEGTTTTATVTGFAYRCPGDRTMAIAPPTPPIVRSCKAEEQPGWASASAVEKKGIIDRCNQPAATAKNG